MSRALLGLALLGAATSLVTTSCSDSKPPDPAVSQDIGPEGGTVFVDGATVTFPKGALTETKKVTITSLKEGAPDGYAVLSKLFKCEPSGTDFKQPVTMQMPFEDDGQGATMFWSSGADPAFQDVGGKVQGNTMVTTVMHFSSGFVGRKKNALTP